MIRKTALLRFASAVAIATVASYASADVVTDWNAVAVGTNTGGASLHPARVLATTHAAMFDAVNSVTRTYKPYLSDAKAPAGTSAEAAAAAAAHAVLSKMTSGQQGGLDSALQKSLAAVPDGAGKSEGLRIGREIGEQYAAARQGDGADAPPNFTPVPGPGKWVPTPPANAPFGTANWGRVKTFVIANVDEFSVKGPPALDSAQYVKDLNEVRELGSRNSTTRTGDQTAAALLWTSQTNIPWNAAARAKVAEKAMPLIESAKVFAVSTMATHDALVAAWHVKVKYPLWRPITAIRGAAQLNDPRVAADPNWEPLINTPPHPDYVSGHCAGSGAAEAALKGLLGDPVQVTVAHPSTGQTRSYTSFTQMADEVDNARVWAGIHTRTADVDGRDLGRRIGEAVLKRFPVKN